jgi:hypothetical protein
MERYVNKEMELRVVARTHPRIGGQSEGSRKGERGYGTGLAGYTREV